MEQQIVPTSPKSEEFQKQMEKKQEKKSTSGSSIRSHLLFIVIVITLVLGAFSGFLGFIIATNVPANWPVLGDLNVISVLEAERQDVLLSSRTNGQSIMKQAPQVIDQIVSLYAAAPTIESPSELRGDSVILTSDGWMVTATGVFPQREDGTRDIGLSVVLPDGQGAEITEAIEDRLTGLTFFKVAATNLSVVSFDLSHSVPVGQNISVIEKEIGSYIVYERRAAGELYRSNAVRNTTKLEQLTVLDKGSMVNRIGSPVFANNGELLGINITDGVMVQSSLINGALQSIIELGKIERSSLDLSYINLHRVTKAEKQKNGLPENGILLTEVKKPKKAGLEAGDVIISVNNTFVTEFVDLGVYIHSRPAGTTLYLTVLRNGAQQDIALEL